MKSAAVSRTPPKPRATSRSHLVQPASANEIVKMVTNPRRYPSPMRVSGSGSAATRCADAPGGTSIDLSNMSRVLRIDPTSVTVQPGIKLVELADILGTKGLELVGGFDLANRTVGGAVSAAGLEAASADAAATFLSSVQQIKFITADGRKAYVNTKNANLLRLMRMSYGLLGIAYEITLRVRPIQSFAIRTANIEFADLPVLLNQIGTSESGLKLRLFPFRNRIQCEFRDISTTGETGTYQAWRLKSWVVNSALPGAAYALAKVMPLRQLRYPLVDTLNESAGNLVGLGAFNAGSVATEQLTQTNVFNQSRIEHSTWAFSERTFADVANAYVEFCQQHYDRTGFRCDSPAVSYRIRKDSSALLAPSFAESVISLTALTNSANGWEDYGFEFAHFASRHKGIPLFSQSQHLAPDMATQGLGQRLGFFKKARYKFDPDNRFLNPFFASYMLD